MSRSLRRLCPVCAAAKPSKSASAAQTGKNSLPKDIGRAVKMRCAAKTGSTYPRARKRGVWNISVPHSFVANSQWHFVLFLLENSNGCRLHPISCIILATHRTSFIYRPRPRHRHRHRHRYRHRHRPRHLSLSQRTHSYYHHQTYLFVPAPSPCRPILRFSRGIWSSGY